MSFADCNRAAICSANTSLALKDDEWERPVHSFYPATRNCQLVLSRSDYERSLRVVQEREGINCRGARRREKRRDPAVVHLVHRTIHARRPDHRGAHLGHSKIMKFSTYRDPAIPPLPEQAIGWSGSADALACAGRPAFAGSAAGHQFCQAGPQAADAMPGCVNTVQSRGSRVAVLWLVVAQLFP